MGQWENELFKRISDAGAKIMQALWTKEYPKLNVKVNCFVFSLHKLN